jgi:hypothetical protein
MRGRPEATEHIVPNTENDDKSVYKDWIVAFEVMVNSDIDILKYEELCSGMKNVYRQCL